MQAYFSHSYRDVPINSYFSSLFESKGITLRADQKTDVWCMAKLERYMYEMDAFVSIITRRVGADDSITFSPYIGRELTLARWARTPRILFVDDQVLDVHRRSFPATAIPFFHEAPETERSHHLQEIIRFSESLAAGGARPARQYQEKQVTVLVGQGPMLRDAASHVAAILRNDDYNPTVVSAATNLDDTFENVGIFETILNSELCVFILSKELSYLDLLLAMTHAHCVPSVRLRYDPEAKNTDPELSGVIRWKNAVELVSSFEYLFQNYQSAFVTASSEAELQKLQATQQIVSRWIEWNLRDGPGLVQAVLPNDSYVSDRAESQLRMLSLSGTDRLEADAICRALYNRIKDDDFYYTFEPVLTEPSIQKIRTPLAIGTGRGGTCIDLACLFAALLEAAHQRPVLVVVDTAHGAHAVAGYKAPDAVPSTAAIDLGPLRGAVTRGEIVVFETTGAVAAKIRRTVGAETEAERREGNEKLDYHTAKIAAERLLRREDVRLRYFIDVQQTRRAPR